RSVDASAAERMRAWACGLWRTLPTSMPGSARSSAYLPAPVTLSGPSIIGTRLPTGEVPDVDSAIRLLVDPSDCGSFTKLLRPGQAASRATLPASAPLH